MRVVIIEAIRLGGVANPLPRHVSRRQQWPYIRGLHYTPLKELQPSPTLSHEQEPSHFFAVLTKSVVQRRRECESRSNEAN